MSGEAGRCRVAILDDNEDNAEVIGIFVEISGHSALTVTVREAETLTEAILKQQPDVGLFDLSLGIADARDVARGLRDSGSMAYLVAMTGHADFAPEDSLAAGFDEHWIKPIDLERLAEVMRDRSRGELVSAAERAGARADR